MMSRKTPGPEAAEGVARGSSAFTISSTAFADGAMIPVPFTCDGADHSPALAWRGAPEGTRAFALIVHDPDAPAGDWIHWLLYDIPGERRELPEAVPGRDVVEGVGSQGLTDFGNIGWGGPCPPRGSSHRYRFRLLALDRALGLEPRLRVRALLAALKGHVLAETVLVGRYQRPSTR